MKMITVKSNQTIFDLAVENYGTSEAVGEILRNNPDLANDDVAKVAVGVDPIHDAGFYLDLTVRAGSKINIDTDSKLIENSVIREINTEVTTFNL